MYTSASENVHLCLRTVNWVTFSVAIGRIPSLFCVYTLICNLHYVTNFDFFLWKDDGSIYKIAGDVDQLKLC